MTQALRLLRSRCRRSALVVTTGVAAWIGLGPLVAGETPKPAPAAAALNTPSAPIATSTVAAAPEAPPVAAKVLFGAVRTPAPLEPRAVGYYSGGCLAGARALPVDGPQWEVMRLSRDRNWGHPSLVSYLERFADDARRLDGWSGLLIGDMSQPRGGPMLSGHASHQVGLDVDIWYTPMPAKRLSRKEREVLPPTDLLAPDNLSVNPKIWSDDYVRLLKRAASFGEVERIFVHPAVKKALCQATLHDVDRTWLAKMRPLWGHNDHFHVRIRCPEGVAGCRTQAAPPAGDGCGKELDDWFALLKAPSKPAPVHPVSPPPDPVTLDKLPADCRMVLSATPSHGPTTSATAPAMPTDQR